MSDCAHTPDSPDGCAACEDAEKDASFALTERASFRKRLAAALDHLEKTNEALETWQTLGVECFVYGETAPFRDCKCNTCETHREGSVALASTTAFLKSHEREPK